MTYYDLHPFQVDGMEKYVCTARTFCPICHLYYQRPETAREMMAGGGPREIVCDNCLYQKAERGAEPALTVPFIEHLNGLERI